MSAHKAPGAFGVHEGCSVMVIGSIPFVDEHGDHRERCYYMFCSEGGTRIRFETRDKFIMAFDDWLEDDV